MNCSFISRKNTVRHRYYFAVLSDRRVLEGQPGRHSYAKGVGVVVEGGYRLSDRHVQLAKGQLVLQPLPHSGTRANVSVAGMSSGM